MWTLCTETSFPCSSFFSSASEASDLKALTSFNMEGPGDRLRLRAATSSRTFESRRRKTLLQDGLWFTDDWRRFEEVGMISGSEVVKLTRFWRGGDVFLVGGGEG